MPFRLDRAFIRVSGPDAVSFLDNLLTQNVARLIETGVLYGALLTPQGKLIADMLIWSDGDGVVLEADPSRSAELAKRLNLYKLRAQVSIEEIDRTALWASEEFADSLPDPRMAALGWRAAAPQADGAGGAQSYDANRIALGAPDLARDAAPDEVFALEALLEELNGVDFQKGCFVGQENVSRMKRRATTRKKFCPVVFEGEAPVYGTPLRAGEAELGSIRSGIEGRAIALLRLDRALEAIEKGQSLVAGDKPVRLAPPDWLFLPERDA